MHYFSLRIRLALVLLVIGILTASPALAEPPPWAGGGKKDKGKQSEEMREKHEGRGESADRGRHTYFTVQHTSPIHDYYAGEFRRGNCPPGLAKKRNGCMPPGLARQWVIGRPLPRGVIYYDLPPSVLVVLGPAPSGHRFVRVAQDILLIAVGTGMVIDAIDDLSWEFNR